MKRVMKKGSPDPSLGSVSDLKTFTEERKGVVREGCARL